MQRRGRSARQGHACAAGGCPRVPHLEDNLGHLYRMARRADRRLTSHLGCESKMRDVVRSVKARSIPALRKGDLRDELRGPRAHRHRGHARTEHRTLAGGRAAPCCCLIGSAGHRHEARRERGHATAPSLVAHPHADRCNPHPVLEERRYPVGREVLTVIAGG